MFHLIYDGIVYNKPKLYDTIVCCKHFSDLLSVNACFLSSKCVDNALHLTNTIEIFIFNNMKIADLFEVANVILNGQTYLAGEFEVEGTYKIINGYGKLIDERDGTYIDALFSCRKPKIGETIRAKTLLGFTQGGKKGVFFPKLIIKSYEVINALPQEENAILRVIKTGY